ncbi:MAG: transcriptional regulator NrdR [Actinobacteria bacterium]|nr:transcriptional regulator NrdR [Actinomycetota bacterium]
MRCPFCGFDDTRVVDSRTNDQGSAVRRRRECQECEKRFTTFEQVEEIPITVIKEDGGREPFNRNKLLEGLMRATVKREVSRGRLEQLVDEIEASIRNEFKREVASKELGERALRTLKEVDRVAYIRFASVYRKFKDIDEFTKELESLE